MTVSFVKNGTITTAPGCLTISRCTMCPLGSRFLIAAMFRNRRFTPVFCSDMPLLLSIPSQKSAIHENQPGHPAHFPWGTLICFFEKCQQYQRIQGVLFFDVTLKKTPCTEPLNV